MSTPPEDPTLLVEQVRHLIADLSEHPLLTDEQINVYLSLNSNSVRRAAADSLDAIASSEALVSRKIRTQDLQTDGPAVADSLRKHADRLRQLADREDDLEDSWDGFDVVDTIPGRRRPEGTEWPTSVWGM